VAGGSRGGQGGRGNKPGSHRKGAQVGSGGQARRALKGKGPTPPAEERTGHPAARRAAAAARRAASPSRTARPGRSADGRRGRIETIIGRNAVVEALRAEVPAVALFVAERIDSDDRVREAIQIAADRGLSMLEAPRAELDRITDGAPHQGIALQVPPYDYADPADLPDRAKSRAEPPLIVAVDGITDPRNLGAIVRSAAAFGAHGVVVPSRRAAGMSAGAWKTSAGAAVRIPVAQAANLVQALRAYKEAGLFVVGLSAEASTEVGDLDLATGPLVLVVGAEAAGLSRLVEETCDLVARIPMSSGIESLNAGVAAGVALYAVAAQRRAAAPM
jgi:23S rRNA (guanosine2251-2'-O)-methyltransferase